MPLNVSIEIRFGDIDKLGHVNNAKYLTYIEHARIKYFEKIIGNAIEWSKDGIILAKAEIDFLQPILLNDSIVVETAISRLGNKSFDMTYTLFKVDKELKLPMARGLTTLVCYNYPENKTIPIPIEWLEKIREFEGI